MEEDQTPSLRHFQFVIFMSLVSGVIAIVVPVFVYLTKSKCQDNECLSLEHDVLRSLNHDVHPCKNFHDHVCGSWLKSGYHEFVSPLHKYEGFISKRLHKALLQGKIRATHQTSKDKVAIMLAKCGRDVAPEAGLRKFFRMLKLPWPSKSSASRLDILDLLVGLSLEYAVPAMWDFTVGRHPNRPRENILYLSLDPEVLHWMTHLKKLGQKKNAHRYFRRCAEIMGGTGQSYDHIIRDILTIHAGMRADVENYYGVFNPEYMNLSDAVLRIAVNRHLPDESQLWPRDRFLVLQEGLFRHFNERFLKDDSIRAKLKLYIGAYLVWYLSPFTSRYLMEFLMSDIGQAGSTQMYTRTRCIDAVTKQMPLVVWKSNMDTVSQGTKEAVFQVYGMVRRMLYLNIKKYDEMIAEQMLETMMTLSLNAYNFTIPWETIDEAYTFYPDLKGNFFTMYLTVARANAVTFRRSMRRPQNDIVHTPGTALIEIYRLLVVREIRVPMVYVLPPLFRDDYPMEVKMAALGSHISYSMVHLFLLIYYRNTNFDNLPLSAVNFPIKNQLFLILKNMIGPLAAIGVPSEEYSNMLLRAYGLELSLKAIGHPNQTEHHSWEDTSDAEKTFFGLLPTGRLFYVLYCYIHCRSHGSGTLPRAICNIVVPQGSKFAKAFQCTLGDPMFFNSTWP